MYKKKLNPPTIIIIIIIITKKKIAKHTHAQTQTKKYAQDYCRKY